MIAGIYLCAEEISALHGCGPLATCVYVWLRTWMDYNTGLVGAARTISRGQLLTYAETEIPRGLGVQRVKPTVKELRCALERLERGGLVTPAGNGDLLVFRMPVAYAHRHAQIKQGRVRAGYSTEQGREQGLEQGRASVGLNASDGEDFDGNAGANEGREHGRSEGSNRADIPPRTGPTSKMEGKASTPPAASTTGIEGGSGDGLSAADGLAAGWNGRIDLDRVSRGAIELTAWLRRNGVAVTAADPRVRRWVEEGIDEGLIARAVDVAKDDRGPSPQPINAGLLDAIVRRLLAEQARPRRRNWAAASDVELEGRARELGIHSVGRSRVDVVAAIVAREQGGEAAA